MDEFVCDNCETVVTQPIEHEPYKICASCMSEYHALRAQLDESKHIIKALTAVLPDSIHLTNESWSWCWSELNEAACEEIKVARIMAVEYLANLELKNG